MYVEVDDGLRLQRALDRERAQDQPKYAEMCRRFLADEEDFSEENLERAGITKRFQNTDLDQVTPGNRFLYEVDSISFNFTYRL